MRVDDVRTKRARNTSWRIWLPGAPVAPLPGRSEGILRAKILGGRNNKGYARRGGICSVT